MASSSTSDSVARQGKDNGARVDIEKQLSHQSVLQEITPPKTLGAGVSLHESYGRCRTEAAADSTCNRRLRHNADHIVSQSYGMARSHDN